MVFFMVFTLKRIWIPSNNARDTIMPLSNTAIRNAKPTEKPCKLTDEKGLYLFIMPTGGKLWRMQYRFEGKQKLLAFGAYPDVSLKEARERRDEARKHLANGADPGAVKKAQKAAVLERAANSFEAVAKKWFEVWKADVSPATAERILSNLERNIFPHLGKMPVADIKPRDVLEVLAAMRARGMSNSMKKARSAISQIMRHALQNNLAEQDPVPSLRGAAALKLPEEKHFAAITNPVQVGELLRVIDEYEGQPEVVAALKMAPLVFVRIGELRAARWSDIDLEKAEWRYTVSKTRTEHLVPLASQAVAILRALHLVSGHRELVFPGLVSGRSISNSTINQALRRMGYDTQSEMTGHGFRAMARTLLAEELHQRSEVIEHQLAHAVPDALGTAYNRTKFLKERQAMMQVWADYLDRLKAGATVIALPTAA
jgi:integrase